ncbi:MAG: alpha/beta hydrolase [Candidatus Latescibacteria bacterium]|nr:alpha/beta hydrolase [Candidatus Latescibacterota bacterium]
MSTNRIYDLAVEEQASTFPRFDISDVEGARAVLKDWIEAAIAEGFERPTDDRIEEIERTIPGPDGAPDVPIRIYMPVDRSEAGPGFVNFHGGGFLLGDLESEHPRCLVMAAEGGAVSVGVDYRLAPENLFPAGVEDCYAALQWVVENAEDLKIDPAKIAIGGGSAGGNLSAAVALMARDRGGPDVAFQMLIYPVTDDRCETPSMKDGDDVYIWTYQNSLEMWDHYIGKDRSNVSPYAAPARAEDLSGLPPAYVMTCEHDPLRDEAIIYAMRLMDAGVPVELHNYPGTAHGFDFLMQSDISTRAVNEGVEAFIRAMAS